MAKPDILVTIGTEISKATKSIAQFSKSTIKSMTNVSKAFSFFSDVTVTAFGVVKSLQAIKNAALSFTDAAAVQEDAVQKLNTALKLSGDFSKQASESMQAFASQLQQTSIIGDEVILDQLALAKSFDTTNEQAQNLVQAAADLSAATGISLDSAVKNLGKTLGGLTGELGEVVPALKNLTKEQLESGAAIDFVAKRFGGAAKSLRQTFSGAVTAAANSFGDLQEEIGFAITKNKAIITVIGDASELFVKLQKAVKDNRAEISKFVLEILRISVTASVAVTKIISGLLEIPKGIKFVFKETLATFSGFLSKITSALPGLSARFKISQKVLQQEASKTSTEIENQRKPFDDVIEILEDYEKKLIDATKKQAEFREELSGTGDNAESQAELLKGLEFAGQQLTIALKGNQGAIEIISRELGRFVDTILPGFGQVATQVLAVFAKGPEFVQMMITEFLQSIPVIIENIILSIPVLIEAILDNIPLIIERLAERAPEIIEALVKAVPRIAAKLAAQMPFIAQRFAIAFISQLPTIIAEFTEEFLKIPEKFLKELIKQLGNIIGFGEGAGGGIIGGVGKAIGGFASGIGGLVGGLFAEGGIVPPGFPDDSFPARLTSGETVITPGDTKRLSEFLDRAETRASETRSNAPQQESQPMVVSVVLGERELAQAIFDLNRKGFRTA